MINYVFYWVFPPQIFISKNFFCTYIFVEICSDSRLSLLFEIVPVLLLMLQDPHVVWAERFNYWELWLVFRQAYECWVLWCEKVIFRTFQTFIRYVYIGFLVDSFAHLYPLNLFSLKLCLPIFFLNSKLNTLFRWIYKSMILQQHTVTWLVYCVKFWDRCH